GKGATLIPSSKAPEGTLGLHAWALAFVQSASRVDAKAPPSRKFLDLAAECGLAHPSLGA
ncbi:MAG: hypothetical protein ACKO3W_02290, partial [bacterium]